VIDLRIQNQCLLTKWLVKLCNEDGIWQQLIKNKYLKHKPIGEVTKKGNRFSLLEEPYEYQGSNDAIG